MDDPPRFHRGSCICHDYELRITRRCLVDDLGLREDAAFEEASGHPIVDALIRQRVRDPLGTKTVGPEAGERTFYRLARGHDPAEPPGTTSGTASYGCARTPATDQVNVTMHFDIFVISWRTTACSLG
jgi:hypothetical protein